MSDTALLVIDVQESFRFNSDADVPAFVERLQKLDPGLAQQLAQMQPGSR